MVNIKLQGGGTIQLNELLYVPQVARNILRFLSLVSKGSTIRPAKYNITINKNRANMLLDARKGKKESTVFYLKSN